MYELDKQQFGAFVQSLRKARGMTQRQLADKLFLSDKAVSKWETGQSIPDTALLIPLSELLEVSVTELLLCKRLPQQDPLKPEQVEHIVQAAIRYREDKPLRRYPGKKRWAMIYALSALLGLAGLYGCLLRGVVSESVLLAFGFGAGFGAYFVFLARVTLPAYYDEHPISAFSDGPLRMNVPGVTFNNANWPYILQAVRIWACLCMAVLPGLSALLGGLAWWPMAEPAVILVLLLGGLFLPIVVLGRKYGAASQSR